ncbi:hypothetical protein D0T49_05840 [Paludibacter sp. 221]|uniref:hypothetical protein n=1 Tax=Paludibacter sp. 221 TaxID=2302939 RepID=UPI0013CFBCB3|nr:hypothetical protein [Paludibacter sp. 221]NDV46563.1 hypothetical protein [Paludibacter sp. 221]
MINYKEILAQPVQKTNYHQLFDIVRNSPEDFKVVFELMFDENEKTAWHAAWICEKVSETHPDYFSEKSLQRIVELAVSTNYTGLQRLLLSMILNMGLPEDIPVEFINVCFERMVSPKSPTGVQALSMKILFEFSKKVPDFKPELKAYLESVDIENYTAGFVTARKHILKKLN